MNILVIPDTALGVRIWASTTVYGEERLGHAREFVARFPPADVLEWVARARRAVAARRPDPGDSTRQLSSAISDPETGTVAVVIQRRGDEWERQARIFFAPPGDEPPIVVRAERGLASRFVEALARVASRSSAAPEPAKSLSRIYEANPAAPERCPTRLQVVSPELIRGRVGEVWASYVVDTTGRALPRTMEVLLSDDERLELAVRQGLQFLRFVPAVRDGSPVRSRVYQRFIFR
jgi:hypothetical protein